MQDREPGGAGAMTHAVRGVAGVSVVAALTLVGESLGLGVAVVALALGALAARVKPHAALPAQDLRVAEPPPRDRWVRVWWALAAALACVPVLRAAAWVVVPALVAALVLAVGGALAHVKWRPPNPAPLPARRALGATESGIALGALVALFAAFVAVQFATLFGGDGYVLRTAGLTYADYARSGFAQLLLVAALTFAVLAAGRRWARPHRALEAALCLLTLVLLASALRRLGLYEETYGFTRLRFAAHAALLYLGALFALVLFTRAPQALVALTALSVLAFALADPERRIAEHNVARYERTGKLDTAYLSTLGADALPALVDLHDVRLACVGDDGVAGFNLARAAARRTSTAHRRAVSARCGPQRPTW
jgi:hypothetical protein